MIKTEKEIVIDVLCKIASLSQAQKKLIYEVIEIGKQTEVKIETNTENKIQSYTRRLPKCTHTRNKSHNRKNTKLNGCNKIKCYLKMRQGSDGLYYCSCCNRNKLRGVGLAFNKTKKNHESRIIDFKQPCPHTREKDARKIVSQKSCKMRLCYNNKRQASDGNRYCSCCERDTLARVGVPSSIGFNKLLRHQKIENEQREISVQHENENNDSGRTYS